MSKRKRTIIIDALNMYFRAYIVDPSLSTNGQPIGGTKGFLKILQKLLRETQANRVIVAWDGPGGSRKKRSVNTGYKEGRKPSRLNRDIQGLLNENQELENKIWQQTRLMEYLNMMPITQIMLPEIEADDVIAYVTHIPALKDEEKVIISSDKDFIQLCNDKTVLFRPIQKEILNSNRIVDKFGIHPTNFALARAIAGDKSDNLPGVPGVGLKSIAKRMPFFSEEDFCDIPFLIEHCKDAESELKMYKSIVENEDLIKENYRLMQLYSPSISPQSKQHVKNAIFNLDCSFNKTEIIKMMNEDGFGAFSWNDLFASMKNIIFENC